MCFLGFLRVAAATATLASVSERAFAQEEPSDEPPDHGWFDDEESPPDAVATSDDAAEREPAPPTAPATAGASVSVAVQPKQDRAPKVPLEREPDQGRFRFGISPLYGVAKYRESGQEDFRSDDDIVIGLETRFGGQINDVFAVYAVPSLIGSDTFRIATGVVVEATVVDTLSFGAGLDGLLGTDEEWAGLRPGAGVQARAGVHFGDLQPSRRKVFSLHTVGKADFYFDDAGVLMFAVMLGYDAM